jgi:shikimate dehydrogenase
MPHKQAVIPFLDEIDPMARRIGAINTIVAQSDGKLKGYNNDGRGFVQSLYDAKPDWRPDSGPILLLGAGGAARAVIVALQEQGAREIRVANRTAERAQELASELGGNIVVVPWERRNEAMADVALLANATDRGMVGKPALDISLERLTREALVGDLIYTPPETPLLVAARERGNVTVNGLGLLLNQARLAFEMWFGVRPDVTPELLRAVEATF